MSVSARKWDDEDYYLVSYDKEEEKIKYFRVEAKVRVRLKALATKT